MNVKYTTYIGVGGYLMGVTATEIYVATLNKIIPRFPLVTALVLMAVSKAVLIAAFYMHLKYETRPLVLVAATPLLFMGLLVLILGSFPNPVIPTAAATAHEVPEVPPPAASGAPPTAPVSPAAAGDAIFHGKGGLSIACASCHSTGSDRIVGPGLKGVGAKGEAYIRESIVNPSAKIVEGFPDAMPKTFAKELCDKDTKNPADVTDCKNLDALVAYLVSLK